MMSTAADIAKPTATVGAAVGGKKWIWLGGALIVGTIVVVLPTPVGLSPTAQYVLGIMAFTVTLWVFNVYENFWIAMSDGMTGGQAFSPSQRLRLAHRYAVVTIVALTISVGYWKLVGIW